MEYKIELKEHENVIVIKFNQDKEVFGGITSYNGGKVEFNTGEMNTGQARAEFDKFIRNCLSK